MRTMSSRAKERFYHDGFIVLRNIVPREDVDAARRVVNRSLGQLHTRATQAAYTARAAGRSPSPDDIDKVNEATLASMSAGSDEAILNLGASDGDLMGAIEEALGGPVRETAGAQLATTFPTDAGAVVNESGYPDRDTPFYGWHGHLDGLWNGATPIHQNLEVPMTRDEWVAWNQEPARNGGVMRFPSHHTTIANYTALLGIPLSDQTAQGAGNLGVLKGAHHEIERFFQMQRDNGGPLGPDGPQWDRIDTEAPNGCGLRHYPDTVREACRDDAATTVDGKLWPRPTLVQIAPGDAILVLHAVPHCATRVEAPDPRFMVYFRLRAASRPEGCERVYPEALCDIWLEWRGMRSTVRSRR